MKKYTLVPLNHRYTDHQSLLLKNGFCPVDTSFFTRHAIVVVAGTVNAQPTALSVVPSKIHADSTTHVPKDMFVVSTTLSFHELSCQSFSSNSQ